MNQTGLEEVKSIMTASPISIQAHQSIPQAILLMTDHRISALPVVNDAKRPIGVLSQKDIMQFNRAISKDPIFEKQTYLTDGQTDTQAKYLKNPEAAIIKDIMTPMVFAVHGHNSIDDSIALMLKQKVHRLFVVDKDNCLEGVVSAFDILKFFQEK